MVTPTWLAVPPSTSSSQLLLGGMPQKTKKMGTDGLLVVVAEAQGPAQDQHLSEQGPGFGTLSLLSRLSLSQMAEPL